MTAITLVLAGEADDDVFDNMNTPKGQALMNAFRSGMSLPNDIAFASRPQTGDYNTDCFKLPANPSSYPWPSWKETPIPLGNNQSIANFGSWNNAGTLFTFSKGGLYQVDGSFGVGFVPGDAIVNPIAIVLKLMLYYGVVGQETKIELSTWQPTTQSTPMIVGGHCSFNKNIKVTAGQTLSLVGSRTRYISSNSSDVGSTGLNQPPAIGSWLEITQLRGE